MQGITVIILILLVTNYVIVKCARIIPGNKFCDGQSSNLLINERSETLVVTDPHVNTQHSTVDIIK